MENRKFRKVLCANRGEIAIRVFRACSELELHTVAIYSEEDRRHQHRYKADEAYEVGRGLSPIAAYLAQDEILDVAERSGVDAIHPGYGFLSENADFAEACSERGMVFIGPRAEVIRRLGDKVAARAVAAEAGIPTVPGTTLPEDEPGALETARAFLAEHGPPILVKAAHGGGGRGMRVVRHERELAEALSSARSEARSAFGSPVVFLERFLERVRHIEVQVLGDLQGSVVHLHERDCSVQRRHQKVIEVAPAFNLSEVVRQQLHRDALRLAEHVGYHNAGTVEFLVEGRDHYFIEVNPRLQVEHTVTEQVTGIDLVQAQIRIAEGHSLSSDEISIFAQDDVRPRGYAIQCRVTTEDPANDFRPDTGVLQAYRSAVGFGIRLDTGNGAAGARISPHYDSLLVKVTSSATTFHQAVRKGLRALREFRIRGVKTNLPFLENVLEHPTFQTGNTWTRFIDDSPELFVFPRRRDRATKLLRYLGEVIVNGHATIPPDKRLPPAAAAEPRIPIVPRGAPPAGTAQVLDREGPEGLVRWIRQQDRPLLTDTTMRDAHQSLLATRVRTHDLLRIAHATAHLAHDLFSLETWGGATFDVAYRFLDEDPWARLRALEHAIPNVLQQMLLRGANAVGYTSYPDNVVEAFIDEAADAGVDVFRIFDSLNDLDNMQVSVDRVRRTNRIAEVAICYTGDVANEKRTKYDLGYYADLARRIEDMGTHILCIKDMAGLLRPRAATMLVERLRETVRCPIHLHTHDTSGNGIATLIAAIRAGVDIVDVAVASMSGTTSQPSWNALVAALRGGEHDTGMANKRLQPLCDYWGAVREVYAPFEAGLKSSTSEVYYHEIPGGQYSNLRPQVASMGLLHRWHEVIDSFATVNQLVGDIPKVTPSSKMVGDFAIFLVQNDLLERRRELAEMVAETRAKLLAAAPRLDFPESVVTYFQGHLGNPPGGFPEDLRKAVLKGLAPVAGRPGASLPPLDLEARARELGDELGRDVPLHEAISHALYPRVLDAWFEFRAGHEDVSILDTPTYFYGMEPGQEILVDLEPGKTLVIQYLTVSDARDDGMRTAFFELNGQPRQVNVLDRTVATRTGGRRKVDRDAADQIGASMPGTVIAVHCKTGADIAEGDPLVTLEAMKMETVVRAPRDGKVAELLVEEKQTVEADDLIAVLG